MSLNHAMNYGANAVGTPVLASTSATVKVVPIVNFQTPFKISETDCKHSSY